MPSNHLRYRWLPRQKRSDQPQNGPNSLLIPCFSLLLMAASRDRIAPNCTIRHPVWPIVALQRRMRFSAPLARFCRIRCHQRRARRAELASFSGFVSNRDFRVPRLCPNKRTGADRAARRRKKKCPPDRPTESRPGLPQRSWSSTFWSKTDTLDAEAAVRPVLSGQAAAVPKSANGTIEIWQGILFPSERSKMEADLKRGAIGPLA